MRRASAVDSNQSAIVAALRAVGATVQSLAEVGKGVPDLLVGHRRATYLLEVKDGERSPSEQALTPAQVTWHRRWRGLPVHVVRDVGEALAVIGVSPP